MTVSFDTTRSSQQFGESNRLLRLAQRTAVILLAVAISAAAGSPDPDTPPGAVRWLAKDGITSFPFEIFGGDIRFRAQVNGRDVHLLLDDGFMWDQLLLWGGPEADALGLEPSGTILIGDPDDSSALTSTTAEGITLTLPGVELTDQTAVITPATSGTSTMWSGSVGQVSATFFKHFVVDINFDTKMITLINPEVFEYRGDGVAVPWRPLPVGAWSIPGTLHTADGRRIQMELMMDLGFNTQVQALTGGEHALTPPDDAQPASLGFNIQRQETRGHIGLLPGVEIGGFEVKDVPTGFVSNEHADQVFHEVMIGLGLLSRFNLVFDSSRRRLFVEPNRRFSTPFIADSTNPSTE